MAKGRVGGAIGVAVVAGLIALGNNSTPPKSPPAPTYTASTPTTSPAPYVPPAPPVVAPAPPAPPVAPLVSARASLVVTGHDVPLRDAPAPKAKIEDRLKQGLVVEEVERVDGWVKIRFPLTTAEGWVKASLVRPTRAASEAKPSVVEKPKPIAVPVLATSVVVARIIAESRADYPGNCACPEDRDKRGHRCGARSAYSRPGGYAPLCYPKDVTSAMIDEYRRTHTTASQ